MPPKPRILAIDDEERGVELVRRILRGVARIETATSGEEGWEKLREAEFDLVISDQRMPGMSGVELLGRVAESSPHTGRILLTGYADSLDTVDAINVAHVHAYLNKPCPPDHLRLTVQSVLDRIHTLRENARLASAVDEGDAQASRGPRLAAIARDLVACARAIRTAAQELTQGSPLDPARVGERVRSIDSHGARIESLCGPLLPAEESGATD